MVLDGPTRILTLLLRGRGALKWVEQATECWLDEGKQPKENTSEITPLSSIQGALRGDGMRFKGVLA
jgi:hypothetical protein